MYQNTPKKLNVEVIIFLLFRHKIAQVLVIFYFMYIAFTTESWKSISKWICWVSTDDTILIFEAKNFYTRKMKSKYTFNTTVYTYKRGLRYVLTYTVFIYIVLYTNSTVFRFFFKHFLKIP